MSLTDEVQFEDDFEPDESSRGSSGGYILPVAALAIPVITGSVLSLLDFSWINIAVTVGTILATTILMTIDATILGRIDRHGRDSEIAPTLFLGMCLLWLVFYPLAFFRRSKVADPNLTLPALVATVFFLSVPWWSQILGASGLPQCDSSEVQDLLVELVRGMSVGEDLESIDGHREIRFDPEAEIRYGHCVAHTGYGDMNIDYQVEWKNRVTHQFTVRIEMSELPACNHPIVLKTLEQLLRQTLATTAIDSIDGYQEIRFDAEDQIRFCRCLVHSSEIDIEIRYLVEWQNRENGEFYVRIPPSDLPACDSPAVINLLERLVKNTPGRERVTSIDGLREIRYDQKIDARFAQCTVSTAEEEEHIKFMVHWGDRETGYLMVRLLPDELPKCTDPEVVRILEELLKKSPEGDRITSIDGYREVRFDPEAHIRFGQCIIHRADFRREVNYLVEWGDREVGYFLVRIPPPELPECDSPEVIQILDQIVRNAPIADKVSAIDGYRELRFDAQSNVRSGRCIVRTSEGDFEVLYKVEWVNQERGEFQVVIIEE